jgi:S1-C subfamily serine protease
MMPPWMNSAVRIAVTQDVPNHDNPWQSSVSTQKGTGVVIDDGLVLCAANLVEHASDIRVVFAGEADVVRAELKAVNHDCDLALLEVAHAGVAPAPLHGLPNIFDEIALVNASEPDKSPSVVKGVVSKIDVERYTHSQRHLLVIAVDAVIELGVGPAYLDGRLVGLAMQRKNDESSVELVPAPIIRTFLDGVAARKEPRVPAFGFATQNLENPRLREAFGAAPGESGVLVIHVDQGGSADGVLQRDDLVLAIDGTPIANNGTSMLEGTRIRYDASLGTRYVGERVRLDIKRGGKPARVELLLKPWLPLVSRTTHEPPQFLVYGGLVFQRLTRDYLTTWDSWWNTAPKEFLNLYYLGQRTAQQHEVVILTQILQDPINAGYAHLYNEAIATLNGVVPRDLRDFYTRILAARGRVRIDTTSGGVIVLDADEVRENTPAILSRYSVPYASSIDA